ncbi:50S ribosomal protein L29 [Parabacteroides sp. FAFU027]|jgi:ribosomal protein L29|uniref:50S ribosomal protein L29 n=1 Tax=Parabacteroides sp. FAFU027 TaxID=2922715 RepID=UPI001FAEE94F|nr:50S ribosomal protein L29 [Parabacteroides sp. FAFU027]
MKVAEIKELSTKELIEKIDAESAALDQMKLNHAITPMDSPAKIKQLRRDIARLKTVLGQRELNEQ